METKATNTPLDDYLHIDEWAKARKKSKRTIKRDITLRRGPKPIRIGRDIYFSKEKISRWLESLAAETHTGRKAARRRASA